jgi:predicted permease
MTHVPNSRRLFRLSRARPDVEADIDAELSFHFQEYVDELVRRGFTPADARLEAERRFGDVDRVRQALGAIDRQRIGRERRGEWWSAALLDVRHTMRGMRLAPGFTALVTGTLALGIAANATMFGIVDRLLLRPPEYLRDADRVGRVYLAYTNRSGQREPYHHLTYLQYRELDAGARAADRAAAFFTTEVLVGEGAEVQPRRVALMSATAWSMFDARPEVGRFFTPEEDRTPAGDAVAVLGYAYWRAAYDADPAVIGKTLRVGARVYTIVGVAPRGFSGFDLARSDVFVPFTALGPELGGADFWSSHHNSWLSMIVRRRDGATTERLSAELSAAIRESWRVDGEDAATIARARPAATVEPLLVDRGPSRSEGATVATWLAAVAAIVLVIACANVANLHLARALGRRREVAVRLALGIGRGRLAAQLAIEGVLYALVAGALGLVLAQWGGAALRNLLLPQVDWSLADSFDARLLAFTAIAAGVAGTLSALAPLAQAVRADVLTALKAGGREGSVHSSRLRVGLLVVQAALAVVLSVGTGLFVTSLRNARSTDLGYDADRVLHAYLSTRGAAPTSDERTRMIEQLLARAQGFPGVEAAAITRTVPFWMGTTDDLFVPGLDSVHHLGSFFLHAVSPEYFRTTGTNLRRGRAFTAADRQGAAPVTIVSEAMASRLWPGTDALGKCFRVGADTAPCREVVGVVEGIHRGSLRSDAMLQYYLPLEQYEKRFTSLFVRGADEASAGRLIDPLRRELQRVLPSPMVVTVQRLQDLVDPQFRPFMLGATLFTIFGAVALALASVGLYGVIAYGVTQRRHELSVRVALGARRGDVLRLVLWQGCRVALAGIALGSVAAVLVGRYAAAMLFQVSPNEPRIYVMVGLTLLAVAVLASLVPGVRATRADPNGVLRAD